MPVFKDSKFPADVSSILGNTLPQDFINEAYSAEWRRAREISKEPPQFILNGHRRHDLDQGGLGDCWFIASAAALATHHRAEFERVVPVNQSFDPRYYTGRFTFYFYLAGVKQKVEVDDYLPTRAGRLIYCSNRERPYEFWPCLLEKAYAKFKGSYAALHCGKMKVALGDLTGCRVEVINIRPLTQGTDDLYSKLQDASNNRAVMAAAIHKTTDQPGEQKLGNGLYARHVYSITGYHQLMYCGSLVNLIRLRNPWGHGEWTGAWSDSSPEMNSLKDSKLREKKKDDGEFWMEFNEFVKHFHEINLCYV